MIILAAGISVKDGKPWRVVFTGQRFTVAIPTIWKTELIPFDAYVFYCDYDYISRLLGQ